MFKIDYAFDSKKIKQEHDVFWKNIESSYLVNEDNYVEEMLSVIKQHESENSLIKKITLTAKKIVENVRSENKQTNMIDSFMQQYSLDTEEGVFLMCLAEALIRVPDKATADALIKDKLSRANWQKYLKKSNSFFVNASTWGLLISGKILSSSEKQDSFVVWERLKNRLGEPVIRASITQAMKMLGSYFVLGQDMKSALKNADPFIKQGYTYSFDMLGEAAITLDEANKYKESYINAIKTVGKDKNKFSASEPASVSIKLSALHPRYEMTQYKRVLKELGSTILDIVKVAIEYDVGITIDAEEADRLELSLKLFKQVYNDPICKNWGNLGIVVQAYSKRAIPVLLWLRSLAEKNKTIIPVRLVKGAYWDTEIKHAQELGLHEYPVFTRKQSTDISYLLCVKFLFQDDVNKYIFPQFASHNAHTISSVLVMKNESSNFELQRLYGMGNQIYDLLLKENKCPIRIYAPVGNHKDLLPYLIRRLLENGTNSSLVQKLSDTNTPIDDLIVHPLESLQKLKSLRNSFINLPEDIYDNRANSRGMNVAIDYDWNIITKKISNFYKKHYSYGCLINGENLKNSKEYPVYSPSNLKMLIGTSCHATENDAKTTLRHACEGFNLWNNKPASERSKIINCLADLLEENKYELYALCQREAGKTVQDCIDEVREAIDFCRYYAKNSLEIYGKSIELEGPTGEENKLSMQGRGVFLCISPWNFPLAIFLGQIIAAISAGNAVIAKPATQTILIAGRTVELAWKAGIPVNVLQMLPGSGSLIGSVLLKDQRLAGVAFTGSTETAMLINKTLADHQNSIIPFIAETGGQNAMIVDSTTLPEQVVVDVVKSAFTSAGQRCSALRVLYVQEDISERILCLLKGAVEELLISNPSERDTDIGPVIDKNALSNLQKHNENMEQTSSLICKVKIKEENVNNGYYIAPTVFLIDSIDQLKEENFWSYSSCCKIQIIGIG